MKKKSTAVKTAVLFVYVGGKNQAKASRASLKAP